MRKIFLFLPLAIFLIGIVFAADVCCEKTTLGAWCQNSENSECDAAFRTSPTSCENTGFCKRGCCIDGNEGLCDKAAIQKECTDEGGTWKSDEACRVSECKEACCILGDESIFTTQKRCDFLSLVKGADGYIDATISESMCRGFSKALGACIISGSCSMETEKECELKGGAYYLGKLCSNPDLNTGCEKQASVGCVDGKDEIYWLDSCGNAENIYSSNKESSWNNGNVLSKGSSCNPDSPNSESSICGNCNRFLGSVCSKSDRKKIKDGDYVCKDLGCDEDGNGINERQNGESWCAYDAYVGDSKDFPGSTHWRRTCVEGEIKVEDCGNRRNSICAEKEIDGFSIAQCRINEGVGCYGKSASACSSSQDCRLQTIFVDNYFHFDSCVPKFPSGFDLSSRDNFENGREICSLASQTCTVVYVKNKYLQWECKGNCNCLTTNFAEVMNDYCVSLGDCGGSINLRGDYTNNFAIGGGKYAGIRMLRNIVLSKYKSYLTKANSDNIPKYFVSDEDLSYLGGGTIGAPKIPDIKEHDFWEGLKSAQKDPMNNFRIATSAGLFVDGGALTFEVYYYLFGVGKTRRESISFSCLPWQPPFGGANCEECNDNLLKPCSEYRCKSLGKSCSLINEDYQNPVCINKNPNDLDPPKITPVEVSNEEFGFENEQDNGVEIKGIECIPEYTLLNFSLSTDEYAQCRADFMRPEVKGDYESMGYFPDEGNQFSREHNFSLRIPSIDSPCIDSENSAIYIICVDAGGNFNLNEYTISFCIQQGTDVIPPRVIRTKPSNGDFLAYGTTETLFKVYINEPSECRYSANPNLDYSAMDEMSCEGLDAECASEYSCITYIKNLTLENKVYIKCNDSVGNINSNDYEGIFYLTKDPLRIDSISPLAGTVIEGQDPVKFSVKTSGGLNNGISSCSYLFDKEDWSDLFAETGSSEHNYIFTNIPEGEYSVTIECEDEAGNIASNKTQFKIDYDLEPPEAVRVYSESGRLKLVTNEKASCYYDFNDCNFNIEDKDYEFRMTTAFSTEHSAEWNSGKTYYIKCIDIYDNINPGCAVIAKSGDF